MPPGDPFPPLRTARDLGLAVRERRRTLGLGQAALAARAGVSRQWIVGLEGGKPGAELGLVLRTLAALGLRVALAIPDAPADAPDLDAIVAAARGDGPGA